LALCCLLQVPPSLVPLAAFAALHAPSQERAWEETTRRLDQARALQEKGSFREARDLYESLLPTLQAEKRHTELAAALTAIAEMASAQGEYDVAIAKARESIALYRSLGDQNGEARAANNLGANHSFRGDYPAALIQFQRALSLYLNSGNKEGEIKQLSNIGNLFYLQGKYMDAWRAYRSAMDRLDQAGGEPWSARWRQLAVTNLATLFQRLGQENRALELYQQLRQSPLALKPSEEARVLINVGVMYRRLGDPIKALETYRDAQELFAREQHAHGQISVLKNIGIVLALDLGNVSGALGAFNRALALAEQTNDRREATHAHLYRGESLLRLNQADGAKQDFEWALATARERGIPEEEWKALYGLGRVARRTGNDDLARDHFRQAIAGIESARSGLQLSTLRAEFLGDKRDVYDALIELLLQKPDAAELFNLMERSRARMFQDQLEESRQQGRSRPTGSLTLEAVQSRLDDSTLLLEFWATSQSMAVVWIAHDRFGIVPKRFSPAEFGRISFFLKDLPTSSGEGWQNDSQILGELLLSGIEPLARRNLHHLLLVPDGILGSMPFEVLRTGGTASPVLVDRFDVSYLPTAAILLRDPVSNGRSWRFPWDRQMVAFGDPIVSSQVTPQWDEVLAEDEIRARLPKSAEEVQAIARMLHGRAEVYLGAADLKKYLLQGRAKGVPLLHLSSHATADVDNPERSRILFSPENDNETADYLFLKEINNLDLHGVDLTTLSACDTEQGKLIRGEGIQGFSRALLSAGSRSAVTTLWRVADQPTAEFMKQFYYELSQGRAKAEALRLAKLKFLRSGSALQHPRHWGAFVLNGDGLQPLPRVLSWGALLMPLAGALLLLGLAARRWL
jgi:CHAT domain-containing protein/Tfp pilus assembly protein PilF